MTAVLLIAPMPIVPQWTGPAIRYWEFARVLSTEQRVTLLVPNEDHPTHPDFQVLTCTAAGLDRLLAEHQVVVVQGPAIQEHPRLAEILGGTGHYLVADLYDPITLEQLEVDRGGRVGRWLHLEYRALLNEQLRLGDFFLCASERQRDYWLGALAALGRVNHDTYDGGELRNLIEVVPFGLAADRPAEPADGPSLKEKLGLAAADRLILWGGGLWDWLDPLTPIRAMALLAKRHPAARLLFFESSRQQPAMLGRARELAADLGLLGRQVLFTDWLSPQQWRSCLLEADVGLSFHPASIETHFAFRTRLLDYIAAGLPIVTGQGDVMADLVSGYGLGYVVESGHAEAVAAALIALLDEPDGRSRRAEAFRQAADRFRWERVVEPLARYCRSPWHAADWQVSFHERWQTARSDRLLSDMAHAERRAAEIDAQARQETASLHAQVEDLTRRLQQSEDRFQAAMNGRVMRLLTGFQRAFRGDRQAAREQGSE